MLITITTVDEELERQAEIDDQIIAELEAENLNLRKMLAISSEFHLPIHSLEIEQSLKNAEVRYL